MKRRAQGVLALVRAELRGQLPFFSLAGVVAVPHLANGVLDAVHPAPNWSSEDAHTSLVSYSDGNRWAVVELASARLPVLSSCWVVDFEAREVSSLPDPKLPWSPYLRTFRTAPLPVGDSVIASGWVSHLGQDGVPFPLASGARQAVDPHRSRNCGASSLALANFGFRRVTGVAVARGLGCLLYTSPSPRD